MKKSLIVFLISIIAISVQGCSFKKENNPDEEIMNLMETLPNIKTSDVKDVEEVKKQDITVLVNKDESEEEYFDLLKKDLEQEVNSLNSSREQSSQLNLVFHESSCDDVGWKEFEKYMIFNELKVVMVYPCTSYMKEYIDGLQNNKVVNFVISNNYLEDFSDDAYTFFGPPSIENITNSIIEITEELNDKVTIIYENNLVYRDLLIDLSENKNINVESFDEFESTDDKYIFAIGDNQLKFSEILTKTPDSSTLILMNKFMQSDNEKVFYLLEENDLKTTNSIEILNDIVKGYDLAGDNSDVMRGFFIGQHISSGKQDSNFSLYKFSSGEFIKADIKGLIQEEDVGIVMTSGVVMESFDIDEGGNAIGVSGVSESTE